MKRNFVHVNDLVSCMLAALDNPAAKQQKFNVCMDEPVDYVRIASSHPFTALTACYCSQHNVIVRYHGDSQNVFH